MSCYLQEIQICNYYLPVYSSYCCMTALSALDLDLVFGKQAAGIKD